MRKFTLIALLLTSCFAAISQVITPFTVRKTVTQKGGIVFLSNTSSKATPDNIVQNEMPAAGTGLDNNFTNAYVDIDGDASTFMSSSDQLNLPACSEITWAGLYWGADCSTGDENFATRSTVKLKVNSGVYVDLTADYLKDNTAGYKSYHCYKDITSIMQANGLTDRYTVANVATDVAGKNLFGGWTIVVVYRNSLQHMRNLTVFDGLANVSTSHTPVDIPISGFQTPISGPVNFELGLVVYDGDRSYTGDQLLFKGGTSFVNISDAIHPVNDVFNSTISSNAVLTPLRNPSYNNTLGYDANIYFPNNSAKNYIGNNAISATIRQTTGSETYLTQVVTSAIDVYEPDLRSSVRVKNITTPAATKASPGDILEYTLTGLNIGSDPSINTYLTDTIEGNAFYVPGSMKILSGPNTGVMTDAVGDDQAEYIASAKAVKFRIGNGATNLVGGQLNNSTTGADSTQVVFRVQVSGDCVMLACDNTIDNRAIITGTGNVSGNTFHIESNPEIFDARGCPLTGSTKTEIKTTGCTPATATVNTPVCPGQTLNFSATESPAATYRWTGPNGFVSSLRNPSISNVTSANAGTYTCTISITGKPCQYVIPLEVLINGANAGPDQTGSSTCGLTTVTLAANKPSGTTGTWSIVSGTGGSFVSTTNPTTNFSGVAGASYVLRWTLDSPGCSVTTDDVNIQFNVGPTASVLSGTSTICYNSYATVRVVITGGVAPYTVTLNNGGGTFSNYTSGNDIVVGPLTTSKTFGLVSVTDANGCVSSGLSGSAVVTVGDAITGTGVITQLNAPVSGGGPRTAGTATNASSGTVWSNITNTTSSNSAYASVTLSTNGNSAYFYLTNLGFTVPTGATITGVEAVIERFYTTTGTRTISSGSTAIGTLSGTTFTRIGSSQTLAAFPSTKASATVGGSTSMWGGTTSTLTPTVVNGTNFGLRIRVTANTGTLAATANIDYVTLRIYYTPAAAYGDDNTNIGFSVSGYSNATTYTWTAPSGGSVVSGQGTATAYMNFNGAGQSGNYNVTVTPSNTCQTLSPLSLSIPITDNVNSSLHIKGNVYWDKNAMTDNLVNGTGIGSVSGTPLYVTLMAGAGTTALQNSVAVASDGTYDFTVSASTAYKVVLSKNNYTTGQTVVAALPTGVSYTGEIVNNITNTTTGNDGTVDGIVAVAGFTTNNKVNVNFGIKIMTPPVANVDVTTTNEDTPVTVNVVTNDTDPDGTVTASTVDLNTSVAGIQNTYTNVFGSWSVNSSGVVTFTPASNFNGNASLNYTVNDNDGNTSNIGTLLVTVTPVNDPPTTVNDATSTVEDTPVTINVVSNDNDIDGTIDVTTVDLDPSTAGIQSEYIVDNQGVYSVNSSGVVTFTPVLNFNGVATPIYYTVKDNLGATSATATISITVSSVIDPPIAAKDTKSTNQNTPVTINVTTNDQGVDAAINTASVDLDPYTVGIQTSYTVAGEGSYTVNSSGVVTFTPVASFYGVATPLNYVVNDNLGHTSNVTTLTITVVAANSPIAANDATTTTENTPVSVTVVTNDAAPSGSLNVSRVDLDPATAGIQQSYYVDGQGTFMVDMLGVVTFQPDWNFVGTSTVDYTVKDNLGLVSNVARVSVQVTQANQPPTANDDFATTNEDSPVSFNIVTNDEDIDGTVAANSVDLDPGTVGKQTTFTVANEGTYTVNASGVVTFTPVLNFNGAATPVAYLITDNQGLSSDTSLPGMINVTVNSVNDLPGAVNDVLTVPSNSVVTFYITTNDTDVDGTIDVSSVDLDPSYPGVQKSFTVVNQGTYTIDNAGLVTFTPAQGFVGPVTATAIHYTVNDNAGGTSNSATITLTLSDQNAPNAAADAASMNEDATPVTIDVTANDNGGSGNIVVSTVDLNPSLAGVQNSVTQTNIGTWSVNSSGVVTFAPVANYYGTATIDYVVSDDNAIPIVSNPATITVTVNPVNDVPTFTKGANQSVYNNSGVQIVNGWLSVYSAGPANESAQTTSFVITNNSNSSLFTDQPTIDAQGNLYYTPALNTAGTATITMKITDNGGTANSGVDASATQTFTITVNPILPTVTTADISSITNISAVGGGDVTDNGGAAVSARGICWSTSTNPTIALNTKTSNGTGNGTFTSDLSSLSAGVTYYVRAYATNSVGTSYGDVVTFQTLATQYVQTFNIIGTPTFTTATINWSNGNMSKRVVFVNETSGTISNPVNGTTYTASANWNNKGTQLGTGYYCVYNGSGSSVYLTHLYPGRLYTIQAFEYNGNAGSESYLTTVGANNPVTVTPWPTTTFYNSPGVSSQEAWNVSSRWDHDTIPTAALHVAVQVYIDGNCLVTNYAESNNLTIKAVHGGVTPILTIAADKSLNVIGPFVNSGTGASLVIKASPTLANGTLTFGSGNPVGSVEMYARGYIDTKYHWQYFGIPVQSTSVGTTFKSIGSLSQRVRKYDESNVDPGKLDVGLWKPSGSGNSMTSGQSLVPVDGYEVVQPSAATYTFVGNLFTDNISRTLSYTSGADWAGCNILSNPYTAAIDVTKISFGAGTNASIYLYNTGSRDEWTVGSATAGTYTASSKFTAGQNGVPGQIPSMQGFLINTLNNNNTNATFGYTYSTLSKNSDMQRARAVTNTISTRVDVVGTNSSDKVWIFTDPSCTHNFDNGWDGRKMLVSGLTQIYAVESDGEYQIDAVNDINNVSLGFKPVAVGDYKLIFEHQNILSAYSKIYLVDLQKNSTTDVTLSGTEYSFTAAATDMTQRFKIITATTDVANVNSLIKVYNFGNTIFIQNSTSKKADFVLYDATGKMIRQTSVNSNASTTMPTSAIRSGVYVAKIMTETEELTQCLIVK